MKLTQPTWKGPISPVRRELAMSSATVKHDETHPLSTTHTIFAIHRVIPHGIAMLSLNLSDQINKTQKLFCDSFQYQIYTNFIYFFGFFLCLFFLYLASLIITKEGFWRVPLLGVWFPLLPRTSPLILPCHQSSLDSSQVGPFWRAKIRTGKAEVPWKTVVK